MKLFFNHKSQLLAGLVLNIALMIYVYFMVNGGPASMRQSGNWLEILNEVPLTILFFLAAILKPYLMVWWRCKKNVEVISWAGMVMLATTAVACLIIFFLAEKPVMKDVTLYVNWVFLWGASTYFALIPQRTLSSE